MTTGFTRRCAMISLLAVGGAMPTPELQAADGAAAMGKELYEAACVSCHATDGKGQPQSVVGFDAPLPDFTDCSFTTPEADLDWSSVVHMGGRIRALDRRMPAFADALTEEQIDSVIGHIRGFCTERGWPRGDLNFPRTFFTEKAFPENEAVLTAAATRNPTATIETQFLYERRIGRRAQFEIGVPLTMEEQDNGRWSGALGEVSAALKYAVFDSFERGAILSAGAEILRVPATPSSPSAFFVETSAMFGKSLPADAFFQLQSGIEMPADGKDGAKEAFWRGSIGKTYAEGKWGRAWSPMVELIGAKEIGGARPEWDVVPQIQVSLSGLQHVLLNVGARVPVSDRRERSTTLLMYILWDWFDGPFFSNWRSSTD